MALLTATDGRTSITELPSYYYGAGTTGAGAGGSMMRRREEKRQQPSLSSCSSSSMHPVANSMGGELAYMGACGGSGD